MFVKAIEDVGQFTRPIHTITRNHNETIVNRGAATLFFVNENGVAVTCKHVVDLISKRAAINLHYDHFIREKALLIPNENYDIRIKALEEKYNIKNDSIVQLLERFVDCTTDATLQYRWINHPQYDLSILIFDNFKNPGYQSHATFLKDTTSLKQGKFLCRLGFPFPEFMNFKYNDTKDSIEWTNEGQNSTPRFPIEGMLTRHLADANGMYGIELSTPGLKGQSGGPLFNEQGLVCGMQSMTKHLHLGFDMKEFELNTGGKPITVSNQPFLHVGHCIHADIIKAFLKANNIKYYEA